MPVKKLSHLALEHIQKHFPLQEVKQEGYAQGIQNAQKAKKQHSQHIINDAGRKYIQHIKTMNPVYRKAVRDHSVFHSLRRPFSTQLTREPNNQAKMEYDMVNYLKTHPYSHRVGLRKMVSSAFPNILYVTFKRGPHLVLNEYTLPEQRRSQTTTEEDMEWVFDKPEEERWKILKRSGPLLVHYFLDPFFKKLLSDHQVTHRSDAPPTSLEMIDPTILQFFSDHKTSLKIFFTFIAPRQLYTIFSNQQNKVFINHYRLPMDVSSKKEAIQFLKHSDQTSDYVVSTHLLPLRKKK